MTQRDGSASNHRLHRAACGNPLVVFEGAWERARDSNSVYADAACTWTSTTPHLYPWFARRGFGLSEQILRECARRGLPVPGAIREIDGITIRGQERRALHFHRFRSRRGLRQPDTRGALLELQFDEPVSGPIAPGFACHYGLGLFEPLQGPISNT